ncbi:ABC transporter family substrate-binding protein [Streptomyces tsukubensis]|uniref:ABC transporter substrate-binding protein n=1 Tax=Streptomyces tsukubensis TaxID=83656 RepID=A0A1V4ACB1_9ACTN|nr:ABC transporter family substrate-binding protein [Streptomyces tsukubensis]OON81324.1 ABC transporter substrate-binding protein [Streptomyces tsukubensis]QFR95558.1 ABC transporter family substrate-binding protein [Streptomyces tsukubensis]
MKKIAWGGVAFIVAASLSLTACGGGGDDDSDGKKTKGAASEKDVMTSYNPQPASNLKQGGKMTFPIVEIPDQLNPMNGNGSLYTTKISWFYQPQLSYNDPKGNVTWNPDYLSNVKKTTVDGNTQVTFDINPKAKWNDGQDMDWSIFRDTWKANSGKDKAYNVSSSDGYANIASVKKGKNDKQAIVTFDGTYVWWNYIFYNIVNPHIAKADAFNKAYVNKPHPEWGAGPYTIDKFDAKGGTVSYKPNPKWWGAKPHLDKFTWVQMEESAEVNAFKNGQSDAADVSRAEKLAQVKSMKGIDLRRGTTTSNNLIVFNSTSPQLKDAAVRKALMEGIDRAQMAKITFQGLSYSETLPGSFNLYPFQKGYEDVFGKLVKFDAAKSKKALDAAGWKAGSDGVRAKGGKKLELNFPTIGDSAVVKARATALAQMMKNIGVKLNIQARPSADFNKVFTNREFDLFGMGFISSSANGMGYICQMYCSDSSLNLSRSTPKSMDAEVKAVSKLPTAQQQIDAGNKVETKAMKTYGILPLYNGTTIWAVKKGVANYGSAQFYGNYGIIGPPELLGWQK